MKLYFLFPLLLFINTESYSQQEAGSTRPKSIEQVMQETERNKGRAAEVLQISYKMLLSKLKEHRIEQ